MDEKPRVDPAHEYEALRHETLESKRYVFERPLAIAALAGVGFQVLSQPQRATLPTAIALITLFNLWFMVNRLRSASRIVAYIQLVLEPDSLYPWLGWETSLRRYRIWLMSKGKRAHKSVEGIKPTEVPDALQFYRPIYYFHGALMASSVSMAFAQLMRKSPLWTEALNLVAVGLGLWSLFYFWRWRPSRLQTSIERNLVIWRAVLEIPTARPTSASTAAH